MEIRNYTDWQIENEVKSYIAIFLVENENISTNMIVSLLESNLVNFANTEIALLKKSVKGESLIIDEFIPEIIKLVDKFSKSGQSGASAPYTAGAITSTLKKLLMFEPIAPVTGEDDEWSNTKDMGSDNALWQNKRCFALFKESDNKPYYLDAIVWKTDKGSWSGNANLKDGTKVSSRQYVKSFPFTPKTFVIDVIEKEIAKDDWEFTVKDEAQLEEVFKYYNKKAK